MKQVQYIKTGLLSNLILILCICATWYSCNDDADQAAAAPEILFMNENLTVDLNKATNPPIVCVINAEAGLKSVQTFIQKTGDVEVALEKEVVSFFNKYSYSLSQTPVYSEDMIGFKVIATDENGKTTTATLPFEVIPLRDAPTVTFNDGINEINYREGDMMPNISITIESEENLQYLVLSEVVNRVEKKIKINGNDTLKFTNGEQSYTLNLQDDGFQFKVGTTALKAKAGAGPSDRIKVKVGTLKVNFTEIPAPQVTFDGGDTPINADEFSDVTVKGSITTESKLVSVRYLKRTQDGLVQIGEKQEFSPSISSHNFEVTLENVFVDVTGLIVEATDELGKKSNTEKQIIVKEVAPAPTITLNQKEKEFNGVDINSTLSVTGNISSLSGITDIKLITTTRTGEETVKSLNITNDKNVTINESVTADKALAGIKIEATDINNKKSNISYDIHVGYYYHEVLMSLDGAPNHEDSTPGCFFSASQARAYDYCDGMANWQEVDIAFSSYSTNTVIRVASLKQSVTKFKHATCGLDKWENVKGCYFKKAAKIKRSTFDQATVDDMLAETLPTNFEQIASFTSGNFETPTEDVGIYATPINGVTKRVIIAYDHFVKRTENNLAASQFMIKVKIEK